MTIQTGVRHNVIIYTPELFTDI